MKLIFVNRYFHPDHSATSQLLSDLAFHLAARDDWKVCVVTSRLRYDDSAVELPARETIDNVEVHRVRTTRFGRGGLAGRALDYLTYYVAAAWRLWRLARRGDVIVAKTDPPMISIVAAAVARARRAALVNWVQDAFPEIAAALGVRVPMPGLLRALRNRSLRFARMNVVLGERMAEWAGAQGVARDRVAVIANWADGEDILPLRHADNPLRREWGLVDNFVVGYSGNLGRAHDYQTVLAAAERLRDDTGIVFLFIGGGHHFGAAQAAAQARGLTSVRFVAYQPRSQLRQSLGVPDVHWISLAPSLEGLIVPSKVYGVLAAGRPVLMVGDAEGEVGRLVRRHGCGVTVAQGDGVALAAAIRQLRQDPVLCDERGRRARAAFDAHYGRDKALLAWQALLARTSR